MSGQKQASVCSTSRGKAASDAGLSRELCSMLCGRLDGRGGGVWGRMDTCICTAKSLCCPPETIALFSDCTPIQNEKLKKNDSDLRSVDWDKPSAVHTWPSSYYPEQMRWALKDRFPYCHLED